MIASLDLGPGDHVFLLDENEIRDPMNSLSEATSLHGTAWTDQQKRLRDAMSPMKSRKVKVLPYTVEKQWA